VNEENPNPHEARAPSWNEEDVSLADHPCESCGSRRVVEIECNDDNPEALEHSYFVCADCGADQ